jgi:hypothetical protein
VAFTLQPVHLLIIGTAAAASAGALVVRGTRPENILFLALAIAASGVASLALYRTLWPLASDTESIQPEMGGGRTRAALEREKTIVLRAIKELEFDRAMRKVSEGDYAEMGGRLRARAVRLIRQLDAGSASYRDLIERELNARLGVPDSGAGNGRANATGLKPGDATGVAAAAPGGPPGFSQAASSCAACAAVNDADARFCKACGAKLGVPA